MKWGNPNAGPYTWTIGAASAIGFKCPIVSMPPQNATGGLLAWSALGHETSGHDVLHADTGLLQEMSQKVYQAVMRKYGSDAFAKYWASCTDESASDALGLLNKGPAAGIGLIGYFRALNGGQMRSAGSLNGPHPVGALRGFMAAKIVSSLSFAQRDEWAKVIEDESAKDLGSRDITLIDGNGRGYSVPQSIAIESAKLVAEVVSTAKMNALEGHSLREIQDWSDIDHLVATHLGSEMGNGNPLPSGVDSHPFFGAHVVAGGIIEALKGGSDVQKIFSNMKKYLVEMHTQNKVWEGFASLRGEPVPMHRVDVIDQSKTDGAITPLFA